MSIPEPPDTPRPALEPEEAREDNAPVGDVEPVEEPAAVSESGGPSEGGALDSAAADEPGGGASDPERGAVPREHVPVSPAGTEADRRRGHRRKKRRRSIVPGPCSDLEGPLTKLPRDEYLELIMPLHVELLKCQSFIREQGLRVALLFEGRDAAGKGGTIKRFTEHMNPRGYRVVALEKPTDRERSQWYFQRYVQHLPSAGEIVLFDRSWYNRAGVERVMGYCTGQEVKEFLRSVPELERMWIRSELLMQKFYFSVSREEQRRRFEKRRTDPLKQWKLSPVDLVAQERWDDYTHAKEDMFFYTSTADSPWLVIKSDDKKRARLNAIRVFLSRVNYPDRRDELLRVDPRIVLDVEQELQSD